MTVNGTIAESEEINRVMAEYLSEIQQDEEETKKISSLFIWDIEDIYFSELKNVVDYLNINTIYADVGLYDHMNLAISEFEFLMEFAQSEDIELFALTGDENGLDDENSSEINDLIDTVREYNQQAKNKIAGISVDLEFYLTDAYLNGSEEDKQALFSEYVDFMKTSYNYAKQNDLKFAVCIPNWYDNLNEQKLEELIKDGCDYVQVMNYEKSGMIDNISKEIELAKKYSKTIENIAELQAPNDVNGVTDDLTFYNDGIDACIQKFDEIQNTYQYNKLGFSYHYYIPAVELIRQVVDLASKYDLEVYPYYPNGDSADLKNVYLTDGDKKIYGMSSITANTEEYIVRFYNLEYGKEYEMVIEEGLYNSVTFSYEASEDRVKYKSIDLITDKNLYSLELYGWSDDTEVSLTGGRLIDGDTVIEGRLADIEDDSGNKIYILVFINVLEYGKEYKIEAEADGYVMDGEQTYTATDTSRDYFGDDVYFVPSE